MRNRTIAAAAACAVLVWAGGCGGASYYRVTDPTTGKQYYTSDLKQQKNGAATLTDARTGNKVSLQNTEVAKVKKQEFEVGKYAQPAQPEKPEPSPFK